MLQFTIVEDVNVIDLICRNMDPRDWLSCCFGTNLYFSSVCVFNNCLTQQLKQLELTKLYFNVYFDFISQDRHILKKNMAYHIL